MESVADTNSVDLKVTELLKEVQLDYSPAFTKAVDDAVSAIKGAIDKIPENLKVTADEAPGFVRDIGADKVEFEFKKPKSIAVGGSYALQCIVKPEVNVDLLVRLPKECFHEKDYLNYRYHAKRCLYLCVIKKFLMSSSLIQKVEWSTLQNEVRKPVLIVYPGMKLVEIPEFCIRIIPTAPSLFSLPKLHLNRNNVRALNQGGIPQATPKYNSSILEDMFIEDMEEFLKKTFLGWKELQEALMLLKVWARQRTPIYAYDCLNGFLISVILSYLADRDRIKKSMKAMHILRVTLNFIATSELWKHGLYFTPKGQNAIPKEKRLPLKESFPVVICSPSTNFNLAFRMTGVGFLELQDESALTLECIKKGRDCGFEEIFVTRVDYPAKYDHIIRLNLKGNSKVYASGFCLDDECWRLYEQKVHNVLIQGLSDRVKTVRVTWRNMLSECSIKDGLSTLNAEPLLIGISVSSLDKAFRIVNIGPDADNKEEALKFRKFWGEKAELRRFKDGKIAESTENIMHIVDQLDFSLLYGTEDPISSSGSLLGAFEILSKQLRLIEDIPLKVSTVQPLDSAFRFSSVFPPEPHPLANEKGSGNWPMDDVAIEKTKSAFLLKIGESLHNNWGMTCTATEDDVDVFVSGYAFRLKIWHERGLTLLRRETGNDQVKQVSNMDRELYFRSQHSSMINGLQGCYAAYGPVVRLAKRWVASHLFSACLVEEAIELLVAYIFLKPLPFNAPSSRITGFLRFLRLLVDYDWTFSALVVDINNDLTPNDEKEISDNFMSSRKTYEENVQSVNPAMFLATAYDKASEAWTRFSPNSMELKRLMAYAGSSANFLTKLISEDHNDSYRWECLFKTPLNNYDAVILLHGDKLPYPQRLLFSSELNQGVHVARGNASKVFHPFLLAGDLNGNSEDLRNKLLKEYSNTFKLWYDSLGGDAVGITWGRYSSKKRGREEEAEEVKDPTDVLKDVGKVGKGFVRGIYLLKAPRLMG
ncbi:unnamed protein product [Prunus armeniaca]|uniref:Nucleolar protein 6 n=1 Tax=Prunus armeniaca TaxID=36596 RepID=A0A6J5VF15_PRUAR|nr:unnamed protein product [Prunus armeniaca]